MSKKNDSMHLFSFSLCDSSLCLDQKFYICLSFYFSRTWTKRTGMKWNEMNGVQHSFVFYCLSACLCLLACLIAFLTLMAFGLLFIVSGLVDLVLPNVNTPPCLALFHEKFYCFCLFFLFVFVFFFFLFNTKLFFSFFILSSKDSGLFTLHIRFVATRYLC